jgi:hypothetical protein
MTSSPRIFVRARAQLEEGVAQGRCRSGGDPQVANVRPALLNRRSLLHSLLIVNVPLVA